MLGMTFVELVELLVLKCMEQWSFVIYGRAMLPNQRHVNFEINKGMLDNNHPLILTSAWSLWISFVQTKVDHSHLCIYLLLCCSKDSIADVPTRFKINITEISRRRLVQVLIHLKTSLLFPLLRL